VSRVNSTTDTGADAAGAILAHSIRERGISYRKGRVLSAEDAAALADAGFAAVVAVRLDSGDLDENEAASRIGTAVAGANLAVSAPGTGRCNLTATETGLAVIDPARVDTLNLIDESVTLATVAPFSRMEAGDLVATVKIITFAVAGPTAAQCLAAVDADGPIVSVAPFAPRRVGLVQSRLPGLKKSVYAKAEQVTERRLAGLGCTFVRNIICDHRVDAVAAALEELRATGCDIALVLGATAIADRADVIPAAVSALGGTVEHLGMPVDPGNLMLLAAVGPMRVLGLPGSARSPRLHGFDWVLQRLVAGIEVTGEALMRMGVGGLLKEIPSRPQPRISAVPDDTEEHDAMPEAPPRIAAIILAAGQSRRMGAINKLLAEIDGKPMVAHAADAALASRAKPVIVVTGHQPELVAAALAGRDVELVQNPDFADGLSTSLKRAIGALPDGIAGAVVCLGDMPGVSARHIDRLIDAFDPLSGAAVVVPTFKGKRGNPVLWHRRFFGEMTEISGDVGARHLIGAHEDELVEIAMDDDAVLTDLDTPAALDAHRAKRTKPG